MSTAEPADFFTSLLSADVVWTKCATCGQETTGTGNCWDCEQAAGRNKALEEDAKEAVKSIPQRYQWVHAAHPQLATILRSKDPSVVLDRIKKIAADPAPFVTLTGQRGSGKTCLAVALMRLDTAGGHYTSAHTLGLSGPQHALGHGDPYPVRRALEAKVLVIDELRDPGSGPAKVVLERVLWERFDACKRTIITTGLDRTGVVQLFGDGAERRLFDEARVVNLGGKP